MRSILCSNCLKWLENLGQGQDFWHYHFMICIGLWRVCLFNQSQPLQRTSLSHNLDPTIMHRIKALTILAHWVQCATMVILRSYLLGFLSNFANKQLNAAKSPGITKKVQYLRLLRNFMKKGHLVQGFVYLPKQAWCRARSCTCTTKLENGQHCSICVR